MSGSRDPRTAFALGLNFLQAFILRERHCAVPRDHREAYFALGLWVEDARARREQFTEAEQRALEELDGWTWGGTDRRSRSDRASFESGLRALREYVATNGHARVEQTKGGKVTSLGGWVKDRRREYVEGTLSIDEIDALEAVEGWEWSQQEADYRSHVEALHRYALENHTTHVPASFRDDTGFGLGRWVATQRKLEQENALNPARAALLNNVPYWSAHSAHAGRASP